MSEMTTKIRLNPSLRPGGYELGGVKTSAEGDKARSERTPLSPAFRRVVRLPGAGQNRKAG